jgi:carbon storage regulator CsrA
MEYLPGCSATSAFFGTFGSGTQSRRVVKMLVLSRKPGESVVIGGGIAVTVIKMTGNVVQLGFDAPKEIPIRRSELKEQARLLDMVPVGS